MSARRRTRGTRSQKGQVRIIGGTWRGRKLSVAELPGLRPSSDRVRETLFNWLSPYLSGARSLDLFAGTGVLGFEALSRGAAHATLLDNDGSVVEFLRQHVEMLGAKNAQVIQDDAAAWLRSGSRSEFDIVFLDPPFGQQYIEAALLELAAGWLKRRAWVYLETEKIPILHLEAAPWQIIRRGQTAHVQFALLEFNRLTDQLSGLDVANPD
jgi:16S rRNA (guanine966-N2)-methyltransferase